MSDNQDSPEPRWATRVEAARYISVHPNTITRWAAEGRVAAYRFGNRSVRYNLNDIDAMLVPIRQEASR